MGGNNNWFQVRMIAFIVSFGLHGSLLTGSSFLTSLDTARHPTPRSILLSFGFDIEKKPELAQKMDASQKTNPAVSGEAQKKLTNPDERVRRINLEKKAFAEKQARIDRKIRDIKKELRKIRQQKNMTAGLHGKEFQVISGDVLGPEWNRYLDRVRKKILEQWYPGLVEAEGQLTQSEVRLDFTIDGNGVIHGYEVASWKGSEKFRDLSVAAFQKSLPFEPFTQGEISQALKSKNPILVSLFFYYE